MSLDVSARIEDGWIGEVATSADWTVRSVSPPPVAAAERGEGYLASQNGRSRAAGLILATAVHLIIVAILLVSWAVTYSVEPPPSLSVFEVAPPAAPPEPQSEMPNGPEEKQIQQRRPAPKLPPIEQPKLIILDQNPIPIDPPLPDSALPVEKASAPEAKPVPMASKISDAAPTWQGQVLAALNQAKRYPRMAVSRRQQGVPWIRFVMDREGKVLSVRLERSSGVDMLDNEALGLPRRAAPLPKPPADVLGEAIELVVPVEFFLRR